MTAAERDNFTKQELFMALRRLFELKPSGSFGTRRMYRSAEQLNAALIADMRRHREPSYQNGDVVVDATNEVYTRTHDGWYQAGNTVFFHDNVPERPLRYIYQIRGDER